MPPRMHQLLGSAFCSSPRGQWAGLSPFLLRHCVDQGLSFVQVGAVHLGAEGTSELGQEDRIIKDVPSATVCHSKHQKQLKCPLIGKLLKE